MRLFLSLLFMMFTLLPVAAPAQERDASALSAGQAAFATAYAKASRQRDMKAFWALVHPDVVACVPDAYRKIIEFRDFQSLMDDPVGDDYTAQATPVSAEEVKAYYRQLFGQKVHIPVTPLAAISIFYDKPRGVCKPRRLNSVILAAPDDNGRWYRVLPCPGERELDVSVEDLRIEMAADEIKYNLLSITMPPKERQALKKIAVDQGSPDYAASLIEKRNGVSEEMAERLVDNICVTAKADKN